MTEFTPLMSLFGGTLIGLSAVLLMAFHGRIAGMTGVLTSLLPPVSSDWAWRAAFVGGAIVAPMLIMGLTGQTIDYSSPVPTPWIVISGLIVGVGVGRPVSTHRREPSTGPLACGTRCVLDCRANFRRSVTV